VAAVKLEVEGHPHLDQYRDGGGRAAIALVAPRRDGDTEGAGFYFRPNEDEVDPLRGALATTITQQTMLTATVRFTDAEGHRWETVFTAPALIRVEHDHQTTATRRISLRPLH
jgi:hypothetical protein